MTRTLNSMRYVNVRSEELPVLGFGTWKIKGPSEKRILKCALNVGYRLFDTAQIYGNEDILGEAIRDSNVRREEVFLVTKLWGSNLHYQKVKEAVRSSLKNLKTTYVDLLLVHYPNSNVPLYETFHALQELKEADSINHIGVSNFTLSLLKQAESVRNTDIFANQVPYHPFLPQEGLLDYCLRQNILLMAYSPLAHGKVIANRMLREIGKKYTKSPAQVSLRWLTQQENVLAIPKASTIAHQEENLEIFDFQLTEREMRLIASLAGRAPLNDVTWKVIRSVQGLPKVVRQLVERVFFTGSSSLSTVWTAPE